MTDDIKNLKNNLEIEYFNNLYYYAKEMNINTSLINNKINEYKGEYNEVHSITTSEMESEVYSDNYLYQKSWNKLKTVHKIIKIKEFINKLVIKDNNNKYKLEKDLVNLIKLKKLTKKDSVYYNEGTGEIISIPCLSFKKNKYIIEKE